MRGSAGRSRAANAAAGALSQSVGATHEAWCEGQHAEALRLGLVGHEVQHNQPKVVDAPRGIVRVAVSVADYTGFLGDGRARTLAVEAKATSGKFLYRSVVTPAQEAYLNAVVAGGGLAILVAGFREGATWRRFAVPWRDVPWAKAKSADAVTVAGLLMQPGPFRQRVNEQGDVQWEIDDGERCYLARYCDYFVPTPRSTARGRVFPRE